MEKELVVGKFGEYPILALCTVNFHDVLVVCKGLVGSSLQAQSFFDRKLINDVTYFGFNDQKSEIKNSIFDDTIKIACLTGKINQLQEAVINCKELLFNKLLPNFDTYEEGLEYSNNFK
jgi:hypothetical protein